MKPENICNAIITNARIDDADRGMLTAWLDLDYGGSCQGFGGYSLYLPKSYSHHQLLSHAGHFIWRCMEIAGVTQWDNISGKAIRVAKDKNGFGGLITGIGHITKEDWFFPSIDFTSKENA